MNAITNATETESISARAWRCLRDEKVILVDHDGTRRHGWLRGVTPTFYVISQNSRSLSVPIATIRRVLAA